MRYALLFLTTAFAIGTSAVSAKVRRPSNEDILQAACYPDVRRLCKDAIPNEDKITACMEARKDQISQACTDAYEATQAD